MLIAFLRAVVETSRLCKFIQLTLGYISLVEILKCGAELDLYWQPRKLFEI
jgi:hypothetical protein